MDGVRPEPVCALPIHNHKLQEEITSLIPDAAPCEQRAVDRGRTGDLHVGNVALHLLSYNDVATGRRIPAADVLIGNHQPKLGPVPIDGATTTPQPTVSVLCCLLTAQGRQELNLQRLVLETSALPS